ncbi:transcription repressor OFP13-like [Aegilops tauschii subsp. strangulata]|uniref:Transcription repressor n=1 Tax=Aegilops tauschii subsp. strangulata TaxID=200361 RepID=A0A453FZP0_AEGTS|nr:transcription repressor OFP13-like [Aegilops tauschii subsp. strangulata]
MVIGKLGLSSLFHTKAKEEASPSPPRGDPAAAPAWAWPSCKHPRTRSFHDAPPPPGARTLASIFLDSAESSFTNSSTRRDCSDSPSTASEASAEGGADVVTGAEDAVVVGPLRSSDRLLFDPGASGATSSILEEKLPAGAREAFVGGLAVAFESADPYGDFRASMQEMVAAHGAGGWGWGWLEEMLGWYLRANGKDTHGAIVAAFVDVIVSVADPGRGSSCSSRSSSCASVDGDQ